MFNDYLQFVCCIFFALIITLVTKESAAFIWSPAILFAVFSIVFVNLKRAKVSSAVIDQLNFSIAFVLLGCVYYIFPLGVENIRVDDPLALFDAQKYALSAELTIENGQGLGHWLSVGIEQYVISIYQIFGVNEVNVIAINSLILIVTITIFKALIFKNTEANFSLLGFLLLVPLTFFYSIQPSKEILSILIVAVFLLLMTCRANISLFKQVALFSALFLVAMLVRLNLAMFLLIFFFASYIKMDKRLLRSLPWLLIGALASILILHIFSLKFVGVGVDFWFEQFFNLLNASERLAQATKGHQNTTGLSYTIKQYLSPEILWLNVVFVPLKMLLVWVSPFPLLQGVLTPPSEQVAIVLYGQTLLSSISGILNFALTPAIFLMMTRFNKLNDTNKLVFTFAMIYLAMVAFVYPTQFTRHRSLVEIPMYLLFLKYSAHWFPSYKIAIQGCAIAMFLCASIVMIVLNLYRI